MKSAYSTHGLRILKGTAKWIIIAAIFGLIVRMLVINFPELRRQPLQYNSWLIAASLALLCLHFLITSILWHCVTLVNRVSIPCGQAVTVWFKSMPGKYIPGKVFLWGSRVFYYKHAGRNVKRITLCFALEVALQLLSACIIASVILTQLPHGPLTPYRQAAWVLLAVLAILVNPRILQRLLNIALKWFGREPITIDMSFRQMIALLLGYVANGFVLGAAFFLFVRALHPLGTDQYLYLTAAFQIAGMVGVLSLFAPGGLGVRDGILLVALSMIMPNGTAAAIVLGARVWATAAELLCVSIAFIHDKITRHRNIDCDTQRAAGMSLRDSSNADVNLSRAAGGMKSGLVGSPRGPTPPNQRSTLMILSLLGFLLVIVSTSRYGVGLSPDSTHYIAAGRSLAQGQGFNGTDGAPYTHWPPLYPAILAAPAIIGIDPLVGARWINAAAFGVIIFLAGGLFFTYLRSTALALLGTVSIVLANPLYGLSTLALSESIFVVLTLLFFTQTLRYLQHAQPRQLLAMALLAMLCCLQRYIGVSVVAAGAVVILFLQSKLPPVARIKHLCLFGVISCTPLGVWLVRSYALTVGGEPYSPPSKLSLLDGLTLMSETLTSWLLPETLPLWFRLAAVALVLVALIGAMLWVSKRSTVGAIGRSPQIVVAAVLVLTYSSMVLAIALTIHIADLDNRTMLPTYVFLSLMLLAAVDRLLFHLPTSRGTPRWARKMVLGFCLLWMAYPMLRVGSRTWHRLHHGAGGYNTVVWRDSPVMLHLRASPPPGKIYSNRADAIYILNDMSAYWGPSKRIGIEPFIEIMNDGPDNYLVWFNRGRNSSYHPAELPDSFSSELIAKFSDGAIYRFERR